MEKVMMVWEVVEMLVVTADGMIAGLLVGGVMVGFNSRGHGWVDSGGDSDCGDGYGRGDDDDKFPS